MIPVKNTRQEILPGIMLFGDYRFRLYLAA